MAKQQQRPGLPTRRTSPNTRPTQPSPSLPHPATNASQIANVHLSATQFSGPLPHPELLKLYNAAIPDGAARILAMAEEQERHRQSLERYVVHQDNWRSWGGLIAGFLICVLFLFGALYATVNGYPWVGGAFGTVDLGALAALFVYSNRARERATSDAPNKGKSDTPAPH